MQGDRFAHLVSESQLLIAVSYGPARLTDRRSVPNFLKTVPSSSSGVPPVAYQKLKHVITRATRWFFACRSWVAFPPQEFDDGSTWATCQLITLPWSRPQIRCYKASSRQPKRLKFKNKTGGKAVPPSGRGHFATNIPLLLLFVHGTRGPFRCLLLPRSVLCSLQYVAEKKSSDCCVLCCVLCRWTGLTCWLLPSPLLSPARCDACFDATNFRGMM